MENTFSYAMKQEGFAEFFEKFKNTADFYIANQEARSKALLLCIAYAWLEGKGLNNGRH